jgi:anti-anti-sigma factor
MMPHETNVAQPGDARSAPGGNGFTVVTIRGELGIAAVPALREQLLILLASGAHRIVVDLSRVTFCDSSGLAVLVGAGRRAGLLGGVLRLAAAPPLVLTVLRLTGLAAHFETFATVPAATVPAATVPAATAPGPPTVADTSPPLSRLRLPGAPRPPRPAPSRPWSLSERGRTLRCSNARNAHAGAATRARRSYVAR